MYCMDCGGEIPENGEFCPACGKAAPRRVPPPAAAPYQQVPYPPQAYAPYPPYPAQPGYPPYPAQPYYPQPYPAQPNPAQPYYPPYPAQPGYQAGWASSPAPYYVVARMTSPLPAKPPLKQRIAERWKIYAAQAGENQLETGLSVAAAMVVVVGVLAMLVTGL